MALVGGAPPNPPPPPPPPGGGGRGGGGRRPIAGRGSRKKQRRTAKRRGRPLQNMERMQVMGIWYQLSASARRSLWESLGEMLGETQAGGPDGPAVLEHASEAPSRRTRVWERDVLRDVQLFAEFGRMTARERRDDQRGIPRLLSIAQGVVRRGREQQVAPADISAAISGAVPNADTLQALYGGPPVRGSSSSSSSSSSDEGGDAVMDGNGG